IDDDEVVLLDLVAFDDVFPRDRLTARRAHALEADRREILLVEHPEMELFLATLCGVQRHRDLKQTEADRAAPDATACPMRGATAARRGGAVARRALFFRCSAGHMARPLQRSCRGGQYVVWNESILLLAGQLS